MNTDPAQQTISQQMIPIRPVKARKPLHPNSLVGKRKDGGPRQQEITPKQNRFITNHFLGMSDRQAALQAGYSESMANTASLSIRRNPIVAAEIRRITLENAELDDMTPAMIIHNVTIRANANLADYRGVDANGRPCANLDGLSRDQLAAIKKYYHDANNSPQVELYDALAANALLAKLKGMGNMPRGTNGSIGSEDPNVLTIESIDAIVHRNSVTVNNQTTINNNTIVQERNALPTLEAEQV
jgi:hypothetical protein